MAARTRVHEDFSYNPVDEENMGSFLSSPPPEPTQKLQSSLIQSNEHGYKVKSNLQLNKKNNHQEIQTSRVSKPIKSVVTSQAHQSTPGNDSVKKVKNGPGCETKCTNKTYKLLNGTPGPQRPEGKCASTNSANNAQCSTSNRKVIIANQSSDPIVGTGKDTEYVGAYRIGTPHPKKKRLRMCSNILNAESDINRRNCATGEICNSSTNFIQTAGAASSDSDNETLASLKPSKRALQYSSDTPRPSKRRGKIKSPKVSFECEDEVDIISNEDSAAENNTKNKEAKSDNFAVPYPPEKRVSLPKCETDEPVPLSLAISAKGDVDLKGGCNGNLDKEITLPEDSDSSKQDPEESQVSRREKNRKRKAGPAPPGRSTPKRTARPPRKQQEALGAEAVAAAAAAVTQHD